MSSNDIILISKKNFKVYHGSIESEHKNEIAQGKDLLDAIEKAEIWEAKQNYPVEYGTKFI